MALPGPSGVNRATPGGHRKGELREPGTAPCVPHSFPFHTGAVSRRLEQWPSTPWARTGLRGLSPPRPSRGSPGPHLLHHPLRLLGGGLGGRGGPAQHGHGSPLLLAQLRADPASRAVPGRCRGRERHGPAGRAQPSAGVGDKNSPTRRLQ